ncbi:MAG: histidinol phosphate phosphatase, partial [Clostridia bacterium]|nr:histidinol phosphate phosphatase [Clostridia bacterium]
HIDVITKLNELAGLFDTSNARYIAAAFSAVDVLCKSDMIFEINTGAIARGSRTTPYPAPDVLARIREKGGRILFSSDCHNKDFLLCGRELAIAAAKNAGFKEYAVLEHDGFKTYLIK